MSDQVMFVFHYACDQGEIEVARRLLAIADRLARRKPPADGPERRRPPLSLVAAHERLWLLQHPDLTNRNI